MTTPYQYIYSGGFGFSPGTFGSIGDLNNYFVQKWATANSGCSATVNSVTPNGGPTLHFGIPYRQDYLRNVTLANGGGSPCYPPNTTTLADTEGLRGVFCPTSTGTIFYQASPLLGPYCPIPTPAQPTPPVPFKILGCESCGRGATVQGNPSDISHGNKFEEETDYVGSGSNPLKFVRNYNSLGAYLASSYTGIPKPLGIGWMATYFQTLMPISVTEASSTRTSVYALRPDGRILTFSLYLGLYTPDADVVETLVATTGGYELRTANDTVEAYDTTGRLLSITPRAGIAVTVNYTGDSRYPSSVTDAKGHTLTFAYAVGVGTSLYKLQSVTDPAGGVISFNYNSNNNLTSVTYPGGSTRGYSYGATGMANSLTQLTDEAGVAYATWTYATGGMQVTGSSHAGGVESYTFS